MVSRARDYVRGMDKTKHTYSDQSGKYTYTIDVDSLTFHVESDDVDQLVTLWPPRNPAGIDLRDWQVVDSLLSLGNGAILYRGMLYAY